MSTSVARAGAGLRLLRTAVFTAVCVVLSATGHVMASCATVPWWTLALGATAVFGLVAPLAGRARSMPAIAAALACGQLALHALFGLGQHSPALESAATDTSLRAFAAKLVCGAAHCRSARPKRGGSSPKRASTPRPYTRRSSTSRTPRTRARPPGCCPPSPCCSATCWQPSRPDGSCGAGRAHCPGWSCCRPTESQKARSYGRCAPPWRSCGHCAPPAPRGARARAARPAHPLRHAPAAGRGSPPAHGDQARTARRGARTRSLTRRTPRHSTHHVTGAAS